MLSLLSIVLLMNVWVLFGFIITPIPLPILTMTAIVNELNEDGTRIDNGQKDYLRFRVSRTGDIFDPISFSVAANSHYATFNEDFFLRDTNFSIPAFARSADFKVEIVDDLEPEWSENFALFIEPSSNFVVSKSNVVYLQIDDNDAKIQSHTDVIIINNDDDNENNITDMLEPGFVRNEDDLCPYRLVVPRAYKKGGSLRIYAPVDRVHVWSTPDKQGEMIVGPGKMSHTFTLSDELQQFPDYVFVEAVGPSQTMNDLTIRMEVSDPPAQEKNVTK